MHVYNLMICCLKDLLVDLDTFNWLYKDLYGDKPEVDLEIKASVLSIKPKMNIIRLVVLIVQKLISLLVHFILIIVF